jgi:hypothetical protein
VLGSIEHTDACKQGRPVPISRHFGGLGARAFGTCGGVPRGSLAHGEGLKIAVAGLCIEVRFVGSGPGASQFTYLGRSHVKLGQREACAGERQPVAGGRHGPDCSFHQYC